MPHVDELLGPATLAAAGLFAAIAVQPLAPAAVPAPPAPVAAAAPDRAAPATVALPAVEIVARRSEGQGENARRGARPHA